MSRWNVLPNTETNVLPNTETNVLPRLNVLPNYGNECSAKYGNECSAKLRKRMFCQITETRVKILNHISNRRLRRMTSCPPTNHPHQNPAHRPSPAPTRRVPINPTKMKDRYSQRVR